MARFPCRCGKTPSNSSAPNDIELKAFTDVEWDDIINLGMIDSIDLPNPSHDVWRCPACGRIYVFEDISVIAVYALEP